MGMDCFSEKPYTPNAGISFMKRLPLLKQSPFSTIFSTWDQVMYVQPLLKNLKKDKTMHLSFFKPKERDLNVGQDLLIAHQVKISPTTKA